ncbi:MAG: hypothetical protein QM766_15775 [Burkholderiaceae bacterium]
MGLQLIVRCQDERQLSASLGDIAASCECFPVDRELFGLSVPTKVIDAIGEERIRDSLSAYDVYELWSGNWRSPTSEARARPGWKFW